MFNRPALHPHQVVTGRVIASVEVSDDALVLRFEDGSGVRLWDNGQSCCEARWMVCDDDLAPFLGETLTSIEVRDGPESQEDDYFVKECQFLLVGTSVGAFTVANYNEHNGYYGGFDLAAEAL